MNRLWNALNLLDEGRKWNKSEAYNSLDKSRCLLGAIGNAGPYFNNYMHCAHVDDAATKVVADVVREQFSERVSLLANLDLSVCRGFNDHKETVWDDVQTVLEKAAIQYDESFRD